MGPRAARHRAQHEIETGQPDYFELSSPRSRAPRHDSSVGGMADPLPDRYRESTRPSGDGQGGAKADRASSPVVACARARARRMLTGTAIRLHSAANDNHAPGMAALPVVRIRACRPAP